MKKILFLLACWNFMGAENTHRYCGQYPFKGCPDKLVVESGYYALEERIGTYLSSKTMREVLRNLEKMGRRYIDNGDMESLEIVLGMLNDPRHTFSTEGAYETFDGRGKKWEEPGYNFFARRVQIYANTRLFLLEKYLDAHKKIGTQQL